MPPGAAKPQEPFNVAPVVETTVVFVKKIS